MTKSTEWNSYTSDQESAVAALEPVAERFDAIYEEAARAGDLTRVPWVHGRASRALVNWMNAVAPSLVRCGARVAVVACALGDDAAEIVQRGYDVTAFDCSERALAWARQRHPSCADCFVRADLHTMPARWRHRFDLVVEVDTLEAIPPSRFDDAMRALRDIVAMHGHLLLIARVTSKGAGPTNDEPWLRSADELLDGAARAGLVPDGPVSVFDDDGDPPARRFRALFRHAANASE